MILSRSCTEGKEANVNGILLWEPVFDPPRRDKRFGVKRMILPGRVLHWGTFLQQGAGYWFLRLTTNHAYNLLACGNIHGDISLWNLEEDDQQPFVILEGGTEKKNSRKKAAVRSVAFSPQDDLLIAASDNCSIKMWEIHPR
jgi:WD40 repeat protein